jgi:hypothetical protein
LVDWTLTVTSRLLGDMSAYSIFPSFPRSVASLDISASYLALYVVSITLVQRQQASCHYSLQEQGKYSSNDAVNGPNGQ